MSIIIIRVRYFIITKRKCVLTSIYNTHKHTGFLLLGGSICSFQKTALKDPEECGQRSLQISTTLFQTSDQIICSKHRITRTGNSNYRMTRTTFPDFPFVSTFEKHLTQTWLTRNYVELDNFFWSKAALQTLLCFQNILRIFSCWCLNDFSVFFRNFTGVAVLASS